MAALSGALTSKSPRANGIRGKLPTKRSINLVLVTEKKINIPKAFLGVIIIIGLAAVFSKFLVVDRLAAMNRASSEAAIKQADLQRYYDLLATYEGVEDSYAHYTLDGMTRDELNLVDRSRVLSLVGKILKEEKVTTSWSVTGNVLTIELGGNSLDQLNKLAKRLEKSSIVESCTITTANKTERKGSDKKVWAKYIIYLQKPPAAEMAEAAETAKTAENEEVTP